MASQRLATFDPSRLEIVITYTDRNGDLRTHEVGGFVEDQRCTIERARETWTHYTGSDDTNTRIYSASTTHTVTIPLAQTSNSNTFLQALFDYDRETMNGIFAIQIKDTSKNGKSNYYSEEAYIAIAPSSSFGTSMTPREWKINCCRMDSFIGGNAPLSTEESTALAALGA